MKGNNLLNDTKQLRKDGIINLTYLGEDHQSSMGKLWNCFFGGKYPTFFVGKYHISVQVKWPNPSGEWSLWKAGRASPQNAWLVG